MKTNNFVRKERPVYFPESQIRAIVNGEKFLTLQAVTPQPPITSNFLRYDKIGALFHRVANEPSTGIHKVKCPLGMPGDLLYVRETWFFDPNEPTWSPKWTTYRANSGVVLENVPCWFSPVSMPKELARLWLKITDVRLDRIQEINEDVFLAEGLTRKDNFGHSPSLRSYKNALSHYWDTRYAHKGLGFDLNPWIWVVSFEIEKNLE